MKVEIVGKVGEPPELHMRPQSFDDYRALAELQERFQLLSWQMEADEQRVRHAVLDLSRWGRVAPWAGAK